MEEKVRNFLPQNSKNFYDEPISSKFTARNCFGNTDGSVEFKDNSSSLKFNIFMKMDHVSMLNFLNDGYNKYF